jgi:hypothetical protein
VERLRVLECGTTLNRTIVLTGSLGNRPESRLTGSDFTSPGRTPPPRRASPTKSGPVRRELMVIPL